MIKHYFTICVRQLRKSALFSAINLLGFVFGMTASFLIYLWVVNELTFDDCFPDAGRTYRIVENVRKPSGEIEESAFTVVPLANVLRTEFPQVEAAAAFRFESTPSFETEANRSVNGKECYATADFFNVLPFPTVEGNIGLFGSTPQGVVLAESMARKLFGKIPAVGQKVSRAGYGQSQTYEVIAVVKIPPKSHLGFDILLPMKGYTGPQGNGYRKNTMVYVKMRAGKAGEMKAADRQAMSRALSKLGDNERVIRFQPVGDIYLHTHFVDNNMARHGNMATIYLFVTLAIVIIFMGAFNFTTLSTARASLRYKEIGARKVNGGKRSTLIAQFLAESVLQALIALLVALALVELTLPLFNRLMDTELTLSLSWSVLGYVLFGIVGVGCLAGSYPAFYLSSINPLVAFKGGRKTGRKGALIKGLVCVQFVIAIVLMLLTGIVLKQLHYMKNKDLGLDKENIVSIYTSLWYGVDDFKRELLRNPDIQAVSMSEAISDHLSGTEWAAGEMMEWTLDGHTDSLRMNIIYADDDFLKVYGLKLQRGHTLNATFKKYWEEFEHPVIINETAWKAMKVADPIGAQLGDTYHVHYRVVGVVNDFNFQSLHERVKPAFIVYNPETIMEMHIKIAPERRAETLKFIQQTFESMSANLFVKEFKYQFFTDMLNKNYERESRQSGMLLFFTVLAIVIAIMGVLGLVSLSTEQRTKEIAIRKVNGAHASHIVRMFCLEYLRWVGIAYVVACPVAWLLMDRYLMDFAYRTPISWWLFAAAGMAALLIVVLTVVTQVSRKARSNPAGMVKAE
ncbi:MAG: ABC transporter permease [Mediterranea sp.]|jgi:putative ABC transport system permease protein|nr:ABC transporter permease [Mediterranea sp.]